MKQTLIFGSDHGGFEHKQYIKEKLAESHPDLTLIDEGCHNTDSVDYPDIAQKVSDAVLNGAGDSGVLVCGTGIGISIQANRNPGIRAAVVTNEFTAEMCKAHNNANIICLGGRVSTPEEALKYVLTWLETPFEGGRHQRRVDKLG